MINLLQNFLKLVIFYEGSTRSCALIRIGMSLLIWYTWGYYYGLHHTLELNHPLGFTFLGLCLLITSIFMFIGLWSQISTALTGMTLIFIYYLAGLTWLAGIGDYNDHHRHHHVFLLIVATCILSLTPCGKSYSVDRWLAIRKAERLKVPYPKEHGPLWGMRLLALQVSVIYFWSAYSKSHYFFLSGESLKLIFKEFYINPFFLDIPNFQFILIFVSIIIVLLEYSLAFGLWIPYWRKMLIPIGALFHIIIFYIIPVRSFSGTMILLYLTFLNPNSVHRFINRVQEN